jgi:dipeptidyl aminopeptidase/acylaminoacyl peptidase
MRTSPIPRFLTLVVLLAFPGVPLHGSAQETDTRTIQPEDYYEVQRLGSPALSPDGRHLLYEIQTVRRDTNDRIEHVWWTDLETGTSRRISAAGASASNPGWTPDGRRLYFQTSRDGEDGLHFVDFLEPGGEAYRVPGITGTPDFHPDGSWVLVSRRDEEADEDGPEEAEAEEEMDEILRQVWEPASYWPSGTPALTGPLARARAGETEEDRNRDVYVLSHTNYKRDGTLSFVGVPRESSSDDGPRQFFRVPAEGLAEGEEPLQLTHDALDKNFREFSRDGEWILFTAPVPREGEAEDEEEGEDTGVFLLPAQGGEAEMLYRTPDQVRAVSLAPDNERLAYVTADSSRANPFIRIVSGGEVERELARDDWQYSIGGITWSADGAELLWVSAIRGQDQLVSVPASGGPVTLLTEGRHTFNGSDLNVASETFAFVRSTAEEPWEAYVAGMDGSGLRRVTSVNEEWLGGVRLSRVEHFTYEGVPHDREWLDQLPERGVEYMLSNDAPDGERFEIDGWLVYPVDYEEGRRYPLVVSIHGGPHSRYAETWFPEFQMLAAAGMFVLYTNPRGSSGYGMDFHWSTLRAWGIDDYKDILHGVDTVVERGIVDEDRLGVTGGSYGGFMTSWITAHDQRWRAALTARGIVNWLSFYGVSDASSLVENEFGGMPWPFMDEEEGSYNLVMMLSPIVWADRVETPTLIIHSINDYRTPLEGGEQWYRALQKHDVPVKMVLFPDSSHGLSRTGEPWLLVRRLHEYVDWFSAYLVGEEPTTVEDR